MPKGNWHEFEDTSAQKNPPTFFKTQSKAELPVRVQKTRVGKGGKTVTLITGLSIGLTKSKQLLKSLKARCGTGGTMKGDVFELQGDHVKGVIELLRGEGYKPKQSGG